MNYKIKKDKKFKRYKLLLLIMIGSFSIILMRLIYLQVYKYEDSKERANTRERRFVSEKPPRGKIYDNKENVLATNKQTYKLTFTETDNSKSNFYTTLDKVMQLLKERNESIQDNFKIKLDINNEPYFDLNTDENNITKAQEIRFKRDRGLNDVARKILYKDKTGELNSEEEEKINEELLKYDAKDTFDSLVKLYSMYDLLLPSSENVKKEDFKKYKADRKKKIEAFNKMKAKDITDKLLEKYSMEQLRNYMLVKDAIKMQSFLGFKPVTIASNIKEESAFVFLQKLSSLPGVNIDLEPMRVYPYGDLACSAIGYVSSINADKKNIYEERGYDVSTDLIGMAGIESAFEDKLKGIKGGTTVKVNAAGRKTEELFKLQTFPGNNVHLTIDKDIQYSAEAMLENQFEYLQSKGISKLENIDFRNANRGAAVAIEVKTGNILALVSLPKYDPNDFATGEIKNDIANEYFSPDLEKKGQEYIAKRGLSISLDELFPLVKGQKKKRSDVYDIFPKPFFNYATMGAIPPGSTFKPLTSVVALEEGITTPYYTISDNTFSLREQGAIFGQNMPADNANHQNNIDIKKALEVSCNNYYYKMAVELYKKYEKEDPKKGLNSLSKYAWAFGLGADMNATSSRTTGIEIGEKFGDSYNFNAYKNLRITYAKYELRDALANGVFPKASNQFVPLDINGNDDDKDSELEKAKSNIKKLVLDKLGKIGETNWNTDSDSFNENIKKSVEEYYNNCPKYQKDIEDANKIAKKEINIVSEEILRWTTSSMPIEITGAAQLAYAAIGQGMNTFSPLQIANYIATLANGGTRYKAHLVHRITDSDGKTIEEFNPEVVNKVKISDSTLQAIKEGMRRANESDMGAASEVFKGFPIPTGGKTGTASFGEEKHEKAIGREAFGVYVSFAPLEDPEIAVCVAIYDGGHGYFGAPVARAIYETYWRNTLKEQYPNYVPVDMAGRKYDYTLKPPKQDNSYIEKK